MILYSAIALYSPLKEDRYTGQIDRWRGRLIGRETEGKAGKKIESRGKITRDGNTYHNDSEM